MDGKLIPAAQYLRMSTGRQECSLHTQREINAEFARHNNFEIVATYSDEGRSGLSLRNRPELARLLDDVIVGRIGFKTILVFDVSRWGRFQDCDEAAHYEFICKRAGVPVLYCAENFSNSQSLSNSVMKALKRTMAAEYSREMGERVFAASNRFAKLGYKQGGGASYGLRRLLIGEDGRKKQILRKGEFKNIRTDRVVLIPGAPEEVETVQEIYRLLIEEKKSLAEITRELTRTNAPAPNGSWRLTLVQRILTDPKYAGYNVWNRTSGRLGAKRTSNFKNQWILRSEAFESVIPPSVFRHAQSILAPYTNEQLIELLRAVIRERGNLTHRSMRATPGMPSPYTFIKRFGSIRHAFELAGKTYPEATQQQMFQAKTARGRLLEDIRARCPAEISVFDEKLPHHLVFEGRLRIALVVCPAVRRWHRLDWFVDESLMNTGQLTLLGRLEFGGEEMRDYMVLRTRKLRWLRRPDQIKVHERFTDVSELCTAIRRLLDRV